MNLFLKIYKQAFFSLFEYPLSFFISISFSFFTFLFSYFLWTYIIANSSFSLYSKKEIIFYFLFSTALYYTINNSLKLQKQIESGNILTYITKDLSLKKYFFYFILSNNLVFSFFSIIIISLIGIFVFGFASLYGILLWFLGFIMMSLLFTDLIFLAFYFTKIHSFIDFLGLFMSVVNGSFFPLDILPKSVYYFLMLLPFKLAIFIPAKAFVLKADITFSLILQYLFWIILFYIIAVLLEKFALKYYEAYGG